MSSLISYGDNFSPPNSKAVGITQRILNVLRNPRKSVDPYLDDIEKDNLSHVRWSQIKLLPRSKIYLACYIIIFGYPGNG